MKKIIRSNTFETNSSSSHALIIGDRKKRRLDYFPRNSEYIYHLTEYGATDGDDWELDVAKLYSEVDKAKFMLNIITSHINEVYYLDDDDTERVYPELEYWLDYEKGIVNPNRTFEVLIKQKPFIWLKEVLEKETGTEFEFEKPECDNFPYYDYFCLDDDVEDASGIDFYNEEKFKECVANIIFNEEITITDANVPYHCGIEIEDL